MQSSWRLLSARRDEAANLAGAQRASPQTHAANGTAGNDHCALEGVLERQQQIESPDWSGKRKECKGQASDDPRARCQTGNQPDRQELSYLEAVVEVVVVVHL